MMEHMPIHQNPNHEKKADKEENVLREMTMEELDAMEAPEVEVLKSPQEIRGGTKRFELGLKLKNAQENVRLFENKIKAIPEDVTGVEATIRATLYTKLDAAKREVTRVEDEMMARKDGGNA